MNLQQLQAEHRAMLVKAGQMRDPGEKAKAFEAAREFVQAHRRG